MDVNIIFSIFEKNNENEIEEMHSSLMRELSTEKDVDKKKMHWWKRWATGKCQAQERSSGHVLNIWANLMSL